MKKAEDLYEIAKKQTPILVKNIMQNVKQHTEKRCLEEATKGSTYYTMYLRKGTKFIKEELFRAVLEYIREFEKEGYKVSIEDDGNDYFVEFVITFSWNGLVLDCNGSTLEYRTHLYDTDRDGNKRVDYLEKLMRLQKIEDNINELKEVVYGNKNDNA